MERARTLLLPTLSPARVEAGVCHIDRKFHTGATRYAADLDLRIVALAPELRESDLRMDFVSVPTDELTYRVETVACDGNHRPLRSEQARVEGLVASSAVVYGRGLGTTQLARKWGVPYIVITEYNLKTNLQLARLSTSHPLRSAKRQATTLGEFGLELLDIARSHAVHCNGYPTYRESARVHPNRLLYFDSRMTADDVIEAHALAARLAQLASGRRPRLLFSGRFNAMKGAMDAVRVGLELERLGLDFELHLYGRGELTSAMRQLAARATCPGRIAVHDAVPFPALVEIARQSDLFVCCHVQDDPSCTYLETFGAGLPIVGYANAMWRELAAESGGGVATPMGDPRACAREVRAMLQDHDRLAGYAHRARAFATEHTFEREFARRIEALRAFA